MEKFRNPHDRDNRYDPAKWKFERPFDLRMAFPALVRLAPDPAEAFTFLPLSHRAVEGAGRDDDGHYVELRCSCGAQPVLYVGKLRECPGHCGRWFVLGTAEVIVIHAPDQSKEVEDSAGATA